MKHYLLYISENYGFEILRPLQQEIRKRGDTVAWFVEGNNVALSQFKHDETLLRCVADIKTFNPVAVFVPGNTVPHFIPGLKVQIFHGFEWKKKGHFRIRNCFDLYCTQGPLFTDKFNLLKKRHPHFNVIETGWPKIDDFILSPPVQLSAQKKVETVLYAPTFSPSLNSAPALFETIKELSSKLGIQWLIKFHPKMDQEWVNRYKSIQSAYLRVIEDVNIMPALKTANVLISDTSSVITEFGLLNKPVITFNNSAPEDHLINIQDAKELEQSIRFALKGNDELKDKIQRYVSVMHPYQDGQCSSRVINATENMLKQDYSELNKKPFNPIRSFKLRKKLNYWKFI